MDRVWSYYVFCSLENGIFIFQNICYELRYQNQEDDVKVLVIFIALQVCSGKAATFTYIQSRKFFHIGISVILQFLETCY